MQASQHVTIHQWRSNATATGQKPQRRKQKQCKSNRTEAAKQSPVRGKEHCRSTDRKRDAVSAADRKRAPTGFLVEKETLSLQSSAHHTGRRPAGLSRNRTGCTTSTVRPRQSKKKAEGLVAREEYDQIAHAVNQTGRLGGIHQAVAQAA